MGSAARRHKKRNRPGGLNQRIGHHRSAVSYAAVRKAEG